MNKEIAMSRSLSRAALAAGAFLIVGNLAPAQGGVLKAGEKAPEFTLNGKSINGDGRTELKEFIGNVIVVDFWGFH
jgi:hypothetical protein